MIGQISCQLIVALSSQMYNILYDNIIFVVINGKAVYQTENKRDAALPVMINIWPLNPQLTYQNCFGELCNKYVEYIYTDWWW